jgi:hypothetical protein
MNYLLKNGYLIFNNFLSENEINEIIEGVKNFKVFDPWDSTADMFHPTAPNKQSHVGYYRKEDLATLPIIDKILDSGELDGYISNYLGKNYKCVNHSMWWTFGGKQSGQEAENFHRDIDNLAWLKVFVYLTDVDMDSGPHAFIPKSHRINRALAFRRFSDSEATELFGEPVFHTGAKGTLILEDTFGLHKGQYIKSSQKRLLLQLQFAVFDNPY